MSGSLRVQKQELRRSLKKERLSIPPQVRRLAEAKMCRTFLSLATYRYADVLLLYAPLPGEPDVFPIARQAWTDGKRVAFPRCLPEKGQMTFHYITREEDLVSGAFGIREPKSSLPLFEQTGIQHSVCIVPALAFDGRGNRLGYGGGYYDRYLASFSGAIVGLCMRRFLVDSLPCGRYDLPVDVIVTEGGVRSVYEKNKG